MIAPGNALARELFAGLEDATYLVSHSMGAAPLAAREALLAYWDLWAANGPEAWETWTPAIARIADGIGEIVGAPRGSTFLAPNVSLLQAAIGSALDFRTPRNGVVYEALQFPSLTYVWDAWQRYGARVTVVPSDDGRTIPADRICAAIDERTAVVVLSHAYYVSGALVDVEPIVARAHAMGALVVLDTYQTAGVYPVDVRALGVDIAVGGSHKWLCGGPGCGYIYVRPELRGLEPAVTGWWAHVAPFAFEPAPLRYADSMSRWATGTPTIPGYLAAQAGHDIIRSLGIEAIRAHNVELTSHIADEALARALRVITPLEPARRTGWIGIDFEGAERVYRGLVEARVFVDYRPGCGLRVGPHFYTTTDDVTNFFRLLDRLR